MVNPETKATTAGSFTAPGVIRRDSIRCLVVTKGADIAANTDSFCPLKTSNVRRSHSIAPGAAINLTRRVSCQINGHKRESGSSW